TLGVQFTTMAITALLIVAGGWLFFGVWTPPHLSLPNDLAVIGYVSATAIIASLILATMQSYVDPVSVSFIFILEPLAGALVAYLYLHESFGKEMYAGALMVLAAVIIQTSLNVKWAQFFLVVRTSLRSPSAQWTPAPETIATLRALDLQRPAGNEKIRVFS